ncbi:MAG: DUF58 domain-containing protein [Gammaproteobacteria bacterium]|nr:DUF58 domain-containing protein [Gammaproteobacteria bacterium]MDH5344286.1 DUF58 domain-containing protein [Gammaproteobacteria bacterium]
MTPIPASRSTARDLLRPEVLASLKNLDLVARSVVEGLMIGLHRSPTFGFSQEFAEYRMYNEGDDPRFIDWNVYARTDRTYIKRFLGDTNSHLMILLDASASMGFGGPPVTKLRYAQFLAASLAFLAARQHDAVGCMVFDEEVRDYREPSTRSGRLQGVLHCLDSATAATGTKFDRPFDKFREQVTRRGLVAVISDFYCDTEDLLEGVRPLAWQGQDVVLFQVLDPRELDPEFRQNVLLEDLETGEAIEVDPRFMKEDYPQRIRGHVDSLRTAAAGIGADHVLVQTGDSLDRALREYLMFRQRRK